MSCLSCHLAPSLRGSPFCVQCSLPAGRIIVAYGIGSQIDDDLGLELPPRRNSLDHDLYSSEEHALIECTLRWGRQRNPRAGEAKSVFKPVPVLVYAINGRVFELSDTLVTLK